MKMFSGAQNSSTYMLASKMPCACTKRLPASNMAKPGAPSAMTRR
jgi:hypothetical protein